MEGIIKPIVDLLKTYAFQGGIGGIAIGAFLLFGLVYLYRHPDKEKILKLFIVLFAVICLVAMTLSLYGVKNWRQISASRLVDKRWAVQLETDDTLEDALKNKERFEQTFRDLVVVLARDAETNKARFYLFNLYSTNLDADNGMETARREWQKLKYPEKYKDSATTKDLNQKCKNIEATEDGRYFVCNNE